MGWLDVWPAAGTWRLLGTAAAAAAEVMVTTAPLADGRVERDPAAAVVVVDGTWQAWRNFNCRLSSHSYHRLFRSERSQHVTLPLADQHANYTPS